MEMDSSNPGGIKLIQDRIPLEKAFPFRIEEVVLNSENSPPGVFHWHSYFEITFVKKGQGHYFVNGQEYTMNEEDIIIFNNVEPHGWKLVEDMHLLVMVFAPEFVAEKMSLFDMEYLKPFVERGSNFKNRIGREEPVNRELQKGIHEIYREWAERREGYHLMIKANVLRILTMLIRTYQNSSGKTDEMLKEKKNSMERLEQAVAYIGAHYCEKITLDEVAASVFMSAHYFSTCFRKVMNVSFSEYVARLRVFRARELLRTTDKSVVEISLECGFHNLSNFYRLYKKYIGKQPREE